MPILINVLLGFLGGQLATRALYDHVFWAYISSDPSSLKSKVSAMQRQDALNFYRHVAQPPAQFNYALMGIAVLILGSCIARVVLEQRHRIANLLSFLSFGVGAGVYVGFVLPVFDAIVKHGHSRATANVESKWLLDIAMWQGAVGICVVATLLLQLSVAEAEEQEAPIVKRKKA
ncbi:hypothetical protein HKX48_007074 [Thoreauomyces humboldtii]|nr:hypothetical protein HKX48_007074 [Thoreauomyces humboldtii]